ncbi:MAG: hypothetical protein EOL87_11505 [Spartobacteria bacterium]|nr:hypothetical protein [Spartobacteria bacterium]
MLILWITLVAGFISVSMLAYLTVRSMGSGFSSYEDAYLNRTKGVLKDLYVVMPAQQIFMLKIISAAVGALLFFALGAEAPVAVRKLLPIAGALVGVFIPDLFLRILFNLRRKRFNSQLIDAMNTLSNGLRSGLSLRQSLELAARDLADPAGQEFRLTYREIQLGVSLDAALDNMARRLGDADLQLIVNAVRLTMNTGGDLPTVFKQITETIRERNRIEGKIKALTSQGKLQALVVGLVPVALFLIVKRTNPEMMRLLYTTIPGWTMLTIAGGLDVIGYFLIRKIISIKF